MGVTTFMLAVGGTSLVCYLLMTRAREIRGRPNGRFAVTALRSGDVYARYLGLQRLRRRQLR